MIDLINAIRGRQSCDWCIERPPTWFDRVMRFDQAMRTEQRTLVERLVLQVVIVPERWLPVWKLGRLWHWKFHDPR